MPTLAQQIQKEEDRVKSGLGEFSNIVSDNQKKKTTKSYKYSINKIPYDQCRLISYILEHLLGCETVWRPMEKIHWWSDFSYKGVFCSVSHQKFGFNLYISDANGFSEDKANKLSDELINKFMYVIKELDVVTSLYAKKSIKDGKIILHNKMTDLEDRYVYYRDASLVKQDVEFDYGNENEILELKVDVKQESKESLRQRTEEFSKKIAKYRRDSNIHIYNQEVAVIYFISLMEHICLLLYAFYNDGGSVVDLARKSWGEKFELVIGVDDKDIKQGFEYLKNVSLYKRNPVAHGFLTPKMTEASFYFEPARQRTAINLLNGELIDENIDNVDLSKLDKLLLDIRKSPKFHNAMEYLSNSEFDVSYDAKSLERLKKLNELDEVGLEKFIYATGWEWSNAANMDW